MQSSPFHTNKMFDGKFSMLNVPKSSKNSSWKLVKDVDENTGSFVYKLVNNEMDNKLLETKLNLMKEAENKKDDVIFETNNLLESNDKRETIIEKKEVSPTKLLEEKQIVDYHLQNRMIMNFNFETFTAKTRNYIFSYFQNDALKVNSKDLQKLNENTQLLDYTPNHLTKINNVVISIEGKCSDLFSNLNTTLSFKFLKRTENKNEVYCYSTSKLKIKNNKGVIFQQFVGTIDSFLPTSDVNIFSYVPTIQIHNEEESVAKFDLITKLSLKISKIPTSSVDLDNIKYMSLDPLNYKTL